MKNIPAHVASAVAGALALVAVLHPGFHVSQSVQQIVVISVTALVVVLQSLHLHVSGKVAQALSAERMAVNTILANKNSVPAPVAAVAADVAQIGSAMHDVTSGSSDQNL